MSEPTTLTHIVWRSPIGDIHVLVRGTAVVALEFGDPAHRLLPMAHRRFGAGAQFERKRDALGVVGHLKRYFAGELKALATLRTNAGGSDFQRRVWALLVKIPPGETRTYQQLAINLGQPQAARAVGLANGANPISLVVPCHRVVGSKGVLTGYGGGIDRKRWLLSHEGVQL